MLPTNPFPHGGINSLGDGRNKELVRSPQPQTSQQLGYATRIIKPAPAHGNDGLKLQEKGGSGQNSAPGFNRRIVQSKELLFPAKFLFSFVDFKSFKGRKKKKEKGGKGRFHN